MSDFNEYRFKGFKYEVYSNKYWKFQSQINDDESKVLVRVSSENMFMFYNEYGKGWPTYCLKLNREECLYLKDWQVFQGYYGDYILIDKNYCEPKQAKKPFDDMCEKAECDTTDWSGWLKIAKEQQKYDDDNDFDIEIKRG